LGLEILDELAGVGVLEGLGRDAVAVRPRFEAIEVRR